MNALIIGSTAAYHWFPSWRPPRDLDLLTPAKIHSTLPKEVIIETTWHEVAQELIDTNHDSVFMDPERLLLLKVSHSTWNVHWDKTVMDIHKLIQLGVRYDHEKTRELHDKLYTVWERVHGPKQVNMQQTPEQFFNGHVRREFLHDDLHEVLKFGARPLYQRYQRSSDLVALDLSDAGNDELLTLAMEEMMVIATERFSLRHDSHPHDIMSGLLKAHKILATSATKGKFARFLILTAYELRGNRLRHMMQHMIGALPQLSKLSVRTT